ncbi:hypothetical protein ONA70_26310 [Micromonospora yasonensis]|uniref:hypothetical protein n=1 Tax=Micromonospora yasonensis TaxID=1128667 RepID=UPI00223164EF|nr:hypothetical protein [Micromonospora yasonensis]MCW3843622.1 hypothetical protein [Micromonospora yasonensis]
MQSVADQPVDAMEKVLGELPMPWFVTVEDVKLALRVMLVHRPEDWPTVRCAAVTELRTRVFCTVRDGGCCARGACPTT